MTDTTGQAIRSACQVSDYTGGRALMNSVPAADRLIGGMAQVARATFLKGLLVTFSCAFFGEHIIFGIGMRNGL